MGFFSFLKPKDKMWKMLSEHIDYNAGIIQENEGKPKSEAEYLAICLILDDLSTRPNGSEGHQLMMQIIQTKYPQHLNDVITYLAWVSGKIHFKPEFEEALKKRHA